MASKKEFNKITKASQYNYGKYECMDVIDDVITHNPHHWGMRAFLIGNAIKYIWRAGMKKGNDYNDEIDKAINNLQRAKKVRAIEGK